LDAQLRKLGEFSIVSIQGPLEIEKTQPFRDVCRKHLLGQKVIFNMAATHFVGSTGIQSFIETLRILSLESLAPVCLVGLKSEFKRIFSNLEIRGLEVHETETDAMTSLSLATLPVVVDSNAGSIPS